MIWSKARFQHSYELLPRVIKEVAPFLLPLTAMIWGIEFYMSYLHKARFDDPYNSSMAMIVGLGLAGLILQAFVSVFAILYVAASTHRQMKNGQGEKPFSFLRRNFHQCLIEYLRGFLSTGLYCLLLIIPGLFRWVQLCFVTLISCFDPKYQEGKVDALKESSRLVRGAWIPLFLLLILQGFMAYQIEEWAKAEGSLTIQMIPLYLTSWIVNIYFMIYFALTFFARYSLKLEKA